MGLGNFGASIVNAASNIWATNKNNKAAKNAAKTQRDWEEYMSNTAHQREMDDLKKAGLNPILTATGGSGASTPSGATAQVTPYSPLDIVTTAKELEKSEKEIQGIEAGIKNQEAQTAQTNLDTAIKKDMAPSTIKLAEENVKEAIQRQAESRSRTTLNAKQELKTRADMLNTWEDVKRKRGGKIVEYTGTSPSDTTKRSAKGLLNFLHWVEKNK